MGKLYKTVGPSGKTEWSDKKPMPKKGGSTSQMVENVAGRLITAEEAAAKKKEEEDKKKAKLDAHQDRWDKINEDGLAADAECEAIRDEALGSSQISELEANVSAAKSNLADATTEAKDALTDAKTVVDDFNSAGHGADLLHDGGDLLLLGAGLAATPHPIAMAIGGIILGAANAASRSSPYSLGAGDAKNAAGLLDDVAGGGNVRGSIGNASKLAGGLGTYASVTADNGLNLGVPKTAADAQVLKDAIGEGKIDSSIVDSALGVDVEAVDAAVTKVVDTEAAKVKAQEDLDKAEADLAAAKKPALDNHSVCVAKGAAAMSKAKSGEMKTLKRIQGQ